ncbi:uncharacterized protein LOC142775779 isoform X2 [Rhipicephalus microplus]|uniref:uncharacterized protein LOC142775779 isoform X2 n=1 Tax=Rhipicephalus microplus TaxID=6941 RepID=UPI003F6CA7D7
MTYATRDREGRLARGKSSVGEDTRGGSAGESKRRASRKEEPFGRGGRTDIVTHPSAVTTLVTRPTTLLKGQDAHTKRDPPGAAFLSGLHLRGFYVCLCLYLQGLRPIEKKSAQYSYTKKTAQVVWVSGSYDIPSSYFRFQI